MTPEDLELDQTILRATRTLKLYRITKAKYANLSGAGAAYAPGRWNELHQEAIYASTDPVTPYLEFLAHVPKNLIPSNLVMMEIHVKLPEAKEVSISQNVRMQPWMCILPSLAFARTVYPGIWSTKYSGLYVMAVPSVIVPSWNVVLYPQGNGFWDLVSLHSVTPFHLDPRLFPENTPIEAGD